MVGGGSFELPTPAVCWAVMSFPDAETTEKLLTIPADPASPLPSWERARERAGFTSQQTGSQPELDFAAAHVVLSVALEQALNRQKTAILSALETRNLASFTQETEKLDSWADDLKVGLERDRKRRELFQRQDEIQGKRDNLIDELEKQLQQQVNTQMLFSCEWELS